MRKPEFQDTYETFLVDDVEIHIAKHLLESHLKNNSMLINNVINLLIDKQYRNKYYINKVKKYGVLFIFQFQIDIVQWER